MYTLIHTRNQYHPLSLSGEDVLPSLEVSVQDVFE